MDNLDNKRKSVIAIGTFDGVHLGHRYLIREAEAYRSDPAYQRGLSHEGLSLMAVTFDRHPASVTRPGLEPLHLTDLEQKIDFLLRTGVDGVCVIRFDKQKSQLPARDFIVEFLVKQLNAAAVFVGDNFRFGYQAAGDTQLLSQVAGEMGFYFKSVPLLVDKKLRTAISSTAIRTLVASGNIQEANRLLGHSHAVAANLLACGDDEVLFSVSHKAALPASGTYFGRLRAIKHKVNLGQWETSGIDSDYVCIQRPNDVEELCSFEDVIIGLRDEKTPEGDVMKTSQIHMSSEDLPFGGDLDFADSTTERLDFINAGVQILELSGIGKKDIDFLKSMVSAGTSGEDVHYFIELQSQPGEIA